MIHHWLALKWLTKYPDEALPALIWETQREGSRVLNKALQRAWDLDPNSGPPPPTGTTPPGYRYLQNTEDLCTRVDAPNAYVAFLSESKYTHPTAISAGAYFTEIDGQVVFLQNAELDTPRRVVALFAAEATISFAVAAGIRELEQEGIAMRDSLGVRDDGSPS